MVERVFQNISKQQLDHADQQSYLVNLGWSNGYRWNDLLKAKRILIISEAGSGKTYECRNQSQRLWSEGKPAFFIELATLASSTLSDLLDYDEEERLETWLSSQTDEATFFLDSFDELKLSRGSFEQALKRLKKGIRGQMHRARIVITTRPIPFDEKSVRSILPIPKEITTTSNEDTFAEIAMNGIPGKKFGEDDNKPVDWLTVALMPLSDEQIVEFASAQDISDPQALMDDLRKRNAQEFARRPQDLIELCAGWQKYKRIRTHHEQVKSNVRLKLQAREDRPEPAELSIDKATNGASRLALAMITTRQLTIRHSAESDDVEQESALDPSVILSDWQPNELKTLLERPLFGFASYGRVRFHHRSVLEFLGAERLNSLLLEKGMPFKALKRLLFAETQGKIIVRPTMRPLAAWLALTEAKVFELLRDNEPAVLLNEGDPESLTETQRSQVLCAYVKRYGMGGWRGLKVPNIQIHRFSFPNLSRTISQLWADGIENYEIRETLLALIETGCLVECADLAHEVAVESSASISERLGAIDALVALEDTRLSHIAATLSSDRDQWPNEVVKGVIVRLFPGNLSIEQLCQNLGWIEESRREITGLSWQLSYLIERAELDEVELEELRVGLLELVSEGLSWDEDWKPLVCDRPHLSYVLAAVCLHGISLGVSGVWLNAGVLALRLNQRNYDSDRVYKALRAKLNSLGADASACLFWVEDSLLQSFKSVSDPWKRFCRIAHHGVSTLNPIRDLVWIKKILGDGDVLFEDRALLIEAAISLSLESSDLLYLKKLVNDQPVLVAKIDQSLKPRKIEAWEVKLAKQKKQQERKAAKAKASWILFQREIADGHEKVFTSERSWNSAWDLWRVMRQSRVDGKASGWERGFIEEQFGKIVADKLRLTLMEIWRDQRPTPTLPSERPEKERSTYLVKWQMGLAAIYAEAEDSDWAAELNLEEAKLTARYANLELNALPFWVEQLVEKHPLAVDTILGEELTWELEQYSSNHSNSMLLQSIGSASESVAKFFVPRVLTWLASNETVIADEANLLRKADRLQQVLSFLSKYGEENVRSYIHTEAHRYLSSDLPIDLAFVWLPILFRLEPQVGVEMLEARLTGIEPAVQSEGVKWFATLFGDRSNSISLVSSTITPDLLLRLLLLAYQHVRKEDDIIREGSYRSGVRDDAQGARNNILDAVLNLKGEAGWQTKEKLSEDPRFIHMKDRILALAEESWAQEIDSEIFDDSQAVALDRTGEAPASTNSSMFAILSDRLSDLDDLLLSDSSPREAWANIADERIMRREIVRELKHASNGIYTVDQEAVTADEKETDIRLRSTASDHEAVIELKLADKRPARDLRDTINDQLVRKYMAAETSRSGCLLITIAKNRGWEHPDTGQHIDLAELKMLLDQEAKCVEEAMGNSVSLIVKILDLRPRLPKEKSR